VAATEVQPPVRVSETPRPSRTFEGPAAAVDPRDPNRVYVAAADLQSATCHVFRSGDGGASYTELDGPTSGG
ncbi:MAG: hypothetical protein ACLGI3_12435, partial [Actinomycetes bacterium]